MNARFRSALPSGIGEQPQQVIAEPFDYTPLPAELAQQVQTAAQRIQNLVQRALTDLLVIGKELLAIKDALPHGHFGPWLRAEFNWTERTARRLMAVAERFGPKTDTMSDLPIEATAAYLLASPSAPGEAVAVAIKRAQWGERITASVARQILTTLRQNPGQRAQPSPQVPSGKFLGPLLESLESARRRCSPQEAVMLARELREFADYLEECQ